MDCQPCLITVLKDQWSLPGVDPRGNTDISALKKTQQFIGLECSSTDGLQSNIPVILGLLQVLPKF